MRSRSGSARRRQIAMASEGRTRRTLFSAGAHEIKLTSGEPRFICAGKSSKANHRGEIRQRRKRDSDSGKPPGGNPPAQKTGLRLGKAKPTTGGKSASAENGTPIGEREQKGASARLPGLFSGKALDASVANLLWGVVCRCLTESKAKLPKNWPTRYCKMDEGYSSALAFGLTGIDDAEDGLPRSLCTDRYGVIQFAWIRG
jgi:hypothetical protein